jgi:NAD(P)-dependent dehydrogenase (short-subunit alcohol dehydrogenase family)
MNYRSLVKTGLQVSKLGYGAWGIGETTWLGADDDESLRSLRQAIVAAGGSAEAAVADVGDPSAAQALITQIVRRHARLDGLVNNSAINPGRFPT